MEILPLFRSGVFHVCILTSLQDLWMKFVSHVKMHISRGEREIMPFLMENMYHEARKKLPLLAKKF